ncbi:hypothetical protein B7494_g5285 [Chlorociboria aeruginascens]|nr:hypothetical protein B7494_g5285 [Chlorociboria aeruginascens]
MSSPTPEIEVTSNTIKNRNRALTKTLLGSQYKETVTSILDPSLSLPANLKVYLCLRLESFPLEINSLVAIHHVNDSISTSGSYGIDAPEATVRRVRTTIEVHGFDSITLHLRGGKTTATPITLQIQQHGTTSPPAQGFPRTSRGAS